MKAGDQHNEHDSYELKWAGEQDADDYKKQIKNDRRDSFAFRNAEGARIRDLEHQMKAGEQHNEHDSYELKWAGERDAEEYQKQIADDRRDSFAFRNSEGSLRTGGGTRCRRRRCAINIGDRTRLLMTGETVLPSGMLKASAYVIWRVK